jgi:bifunctional DNA-binding transcriptional regulator/antitoxin component of YhaV-PrlF toxin-antitoxin module
MATKARRDRTRLSSKHQVTIPIDVVREARLRVGDEFRVFVDEEKPVVLARVDDIIECFAGSMPGVWPDG